MNKPTSFKLKVYDILFRMIEKFYNWSLDLWSDEWFKLNEERLK